MADPTSKLVSDNLYSQTYSDRDHACGLGPPECFRRLALLPVPETEKSGADLGDDYHALYTQCHTVLGTFPTNKSNKE